jgi:hypothetical protein
VEYIYSAASNASCPDGVLILCDFHKVLKWAGMGDFKVYMAAGRKVLMCKLGLTLEKMMIKDNWTLQTQPIQEDEGTFKMLRNLQLEPMTISTAVYH